VLLAVKVISPMPIAFIVNSSVETCAENTSKKICHKCVDEIIDETAKKAIEKSVDACVGSTKSYFSIAYDYIVNKLS